MAEDCTDGDYLGAYSRFFSEFVARMNPYDQLPVSVSSYNVTEAEIVGEIINVTLQYLNQTPCPPTLQGHLVHRVIQEIKSMCKKQPEDCGFKSQEKTYTSLKLMQAITGKVNEICTLYLDNILLLAVLPPPLSTPLPEVTAGGSKNCRRKMEDRYVVLHDLHTIFGIHGGSIANYYAVFDGHAGQDAAVYCATHLHQYLTESIYYPTDPERALRDAFITTDTQYVEKSKIQKISGGTTAVCTLILNKKLYVAWVGDSTATLIKRDSVVQLVNPHRLNREDEVQRVRKMGGLVMRSAGIMRVNGILGVSRAIGDVQYKPFVTGEPEIKSVPLDGTEDFLVLATDGLTDYLEPAEILTILYHEIQQNPSGFKRVHQTLVQCAKRAGSTDNITVVVVLLTPASEIAARPQNAHPYQRLHVNGILEKMNSKDKPLFLDIDNTRNAINSNILKQTMISQDNRDRDDDGILSASNGKHENGDGDYDYSDLGPETDVDALDDVTTMPVKNLSYEFFKEDSSRDDEHPNKDSNILDNMDIDESMNDNATHGPISDNNLHEDDDDDDDDDDDEDERENNDALGEILPSKLVQDDVSENSHENTRNETSNKVHESLEEHLDDETEVKLKDQTDDALDVVDEAGHVDYDDLPASPRANKPLQHALIHEADNVADSEDSEDEWNYYRVDPNKEKDTTTPVGEAEESRKEEETEISEKLLEDTESKIQSDEVEEEIKCESPNEESPELINTEISAESKEEELKEEKENLREEEQEKLKDMDFQLNPNAAEFIPVSPQFIRTQMNLSDDFPVSGSPFKQVPPMDDIQLPSQSEFEKEVCQRPREVDTEENEEYQNGEHLQRSDYVDFMSERQKAAAMIANLDDSEISSTKAEFGDESSASFLTTSELQGTGMCAIEESFSSLERDYDIAKDPMAMSFTPSDFQDAFDKGVDLNAVHNLSNTDLDDKNGSMEREEEDDEEEDDFVRRSPDVQRESTDLKAAPEAEEPADKPAFPEESAELVNLSSQQEDSEDTFIEHADEPKTTTIDLLCMQPVSSLVETQEAARYDHSPSTENYSGEFESEKEPISVDNEQPLSPSSADIDETKPIDEASEDAALPEHDFQKEACANQADTPTSMSPVPDAMECDLMPPTESTEIQSSTVLHSSLHPDVSEFTPREYNFGQYKDESFGMEADQVCQLKPAEAVDVCQTSPVESNEAYQPFVESETDEKIEAARQNFDEQPQLDQKLLLDEKEDEEPVCTRQTMPEQDNLLDFTAGQDVCVKPSLIQSDLTPPLSPREDECKLPQTVDDTICPVESSVSAEEKIETIESKEVPEVTSVVENKEEEIMEAMEETLESTKPTEPAEPDEPIEPVKEPTLNLSESMQEFTGLENQLLPKEEEVVPESTTVAEIHEEARKEEATEIMAEPVKVSEPVLIIEQEEKKEEIREIAAESKEVKAMESEFKELEAKEPEIEEAGAKELEVKEPAIRELEIKKPEIKEPAVTEPETKQEVTEAEIKEPEVTEPEIKQQEVTEPEIKQPKVTEPEIKQPKVTEPPIKEPESTEPPVKEPQPTEPEVQEAKLEKPAEDSEKKSVSAIAVAAAVATAVTVATGAAATAHSKAKVKSTATKPPKTTTAASKTAPTKSTPTSPSKTVTSTTRTSTASAKKPSTTTPTRPKDLDAPKKSTISSTTASKPPAPKIASKTTASTTATKPASRTSIGIAAKSKPATVSSPKSTITDKKPTTNGDAKPLSKATAAKPLSKTAPVPKSSLIKTSTTRMSAGSTAIAKARPGSATATTKSAVAAKSTSSAVSSTVASNARPKTAPASGNATKQRTPGTKAPMIDKQVKETANKQISMARTNTATSKTTSRLSTSSSSTTTTTTTTARRVSSTTKSSTTSSPTKKAVTGSKILGKVPVGGKATSEKGKIVQNGVTEKVEINAIIDDVPKKDLSPVVAPNDNQLITSSD